MEILVAREPAGDVLRAGIPDICKIPIKPAVDKANAVRPSNPVLVVDDKMVYALRVEVQKLVPVRRNLMEQDVEDDCRIGARERFDEPRFSKRPLAQFDAVISAGAVACQSRDVAVRNGAMADPAPQRME